MIRIRPDPDPKTEKHCLKHSRQQIRLTCCCCCCCCCTSASGSAGTMSSSKGESAGYSKPCIKRHEEISPNQYIEHIILKKQVKLNEL